MQRRNFLILGSIFGLSSALKAKGADRFTQEFKEVEATIAAVQEHMFPEGSKLPSAKAMNATQFLFQTVAHKTYDRDIRAFVIEGAKELQSREKGKFTSMNTEEKERALRSYEKSGYGRNWLSRIMTLTMEGMFGDPIYGSNVKESGWRALQSFGGQPRPQNWYLGS